MKKIFLSIVVVCVVSACDLLKKPEVVKDSVKHKSSMHAHDYEAPYQAFKTRKTDVIHTQLKVSFNWQKQEVYGSAALQLKPYFYPIQTVDLDAQGMEIKSVQLRDKSGNLSQLSYTYSDSLNLIVKLPKTYTRKDTAVIVVDYIARPNLLNKKTHQTIREDKGLYFINPTGKLPNKPQQIWTQGEPMANSAWFPTIDAPNEKMTQEVWITVDNQFITLSNGSLVNSEKHPDGTRTDYWKQSLPHAPYLTMLAVGKYAEIKDQWEGIPVNYYVEPKDSSDALLNFGNTPKMITFFSDLFGYKYPWDKYHQIVVRDFVAGAMENTSAVIHAKWVFRDKNQLIDERKETIVAHELVHHWFGDLITCKSWAHLTLNEGFATYGQFLWQEYKYGKAAGEYELYLAKQRYLRDQPYKHLIRHHHHNPRELFDGHSYAKGALVLHQLRNHLGDEAFFTGLAHFLTKHAYKAVEIHDFRIAMEEVCGEDLHWIFNQWFLDKGHPILQLSHRIQSDSLIVTIEQQQVQLGYPLFKFPVDLSIYAGGKNSDEIVVSKAKEEFIFTGYSKVDLLSLNPENTICLEVKQDLNPQEALFKYQEEKDVRNQLAALAAIKGDTSFAANELLYAATKAPHYALRRTALNYWSETPRAKSEDYKLLLVDHFRKDTISLVRSASIGNLIKTFPQDTLLIEVYKKALNDSSYAVKIAAIKALFEIKREDALLRAAELESISDPSMIKTLSALYEDVNDESKVKYYRWALQETEGAVKKSVLESFRKYLSRKGSGTMKMALKELENTAVNENNILVREVAALAVFDLYQIHLKRVEDIEKDIVDKKNASKGKSFDLQMLEEKHEELKEKEAELKAILLTIYQSETNKTILTNWEKAGFTLSAL